MARVGSLRRCSRATTLPFKRGQQVSRPRLEDSGVGTSSARPELSLAEPGASLGAVRLYS